MNPDKLMIVAHPDDELLWGGGNLLASHGWHVVVATNDNTSRKIEFYKTMSHLGVVSCEMHNVKDEYTEDMNTAKKLFKNKPFIKRLTQLAKKHWYKVLTHDADGEYGHTHHKTVHLLVTSIFHKYHNYSVSYFSIDHKLRVPPIFFKEKVLASKYYAPMQTICKLLYKDKLNKMSFLERAYITNETIYIYDYHALRTVPKLIHQIWFGPKAIEPYKKYLFDKNKRIAKSQGIEYKLWTAKDFTFENLPLTWDAIQKCLKIGEELNLSKWAQVADMARYELVYRYGGIYLDSLFEISSNLYDAIAKLNTKGTTLIGANEDPCEFKCKNGKNIPYLTNGFFAATPRNEMLRRLLDKIQQNKLNFKSVYINRVTGPYFFRSGITDADIKEGRIKLLPMESIYPFMVNDSTYRKKEPNKCLTSKPTKSSIKVNDTTYFTKNCLKKHYPKALTVYNSGLGGTWDWTTKKK